MTDEYTKGYKAGKELVADVRRMLETRAERERKSLIHVIKTILVKDNIPAQTINKIDNALPYKHFDN